MQRVCEDPERLVSYLDHDRCDGATEEQSEGEQLVTQHTPETQSVINNVPINNQQGRTDILNKVKKVRAETHLYYNTIILYRHTLKHRIYRKDLIHI